ncbi:MAG: hypothetical protein WCJ18_10280, partial [Planctomycetota bacterium]
MATTSALPDASFPVDGQPPAAAPAVAYDREVLRVQLDLLRRAAAVRARLENEITAEHEAERQATLAAAEKNQAATNEKYAREIAATKQEYKAVLQKIAAMAVAEQAKLDEQRKTVATTIVRTCDKQTRQLKEDDQFEESSYKEVFKEK